MKIYIPNSAFLGNLEGLLKKIDLGNPERLEIIAHDKWISVHPLVVAMIAAIGKSYEPKNISCPAIIARSGHYLTVMKLFDFIGIADPVVQSIEKHELTGRVIPVTEIKNQDDLDKFLQELIPVLHLDQKKMEIVQYIFSELIRNVLEHAQSKIGAIVCAQYFKTGNRISIGIVDRGKGLQESIRNAYPYVNTHELALKLALQPGITGTTKRVGGTSENAGMGLFFIKSIAVVNGNFFNVVSGNIMYKLRKRNDEGKYIKLYIDPFDDKHTKVKIPHWQGVAIGIDISLNDTQELNSILRYIHNFYKKSIKIIKKKRYYKQPKFL